MSRGTINFGHGQRANGTFDPGAIGSNGTRECDVVRAIGQIVVSELQRLGHTINAIQTGDLATITTSANNFGSDWFVSIHANSATDSSAHGTEVHISGTGGNAEKLAKAILSEVVATTGLTNRGIKVTGLYVNVHTNMPSCLVETAFISNHQEEALLKDSDWQRKEAIAIVKGIQAYLGLEYKPEVIEAPRYRIKVNGEQINLASLPLADQIYESLKNTCKPGDVITLERESNGEVTSRFVVPTPPPPPPEVIVEPSVPTPPPVIVPVEPQPTNEQIEQGIRKALIELIKKVLVYLKVIKE